MNSIFDLVIVDTSALERYSFDFIGMNSQTIPSFYELLKNERIQILNHPVLDSEIRNHISKAKFVEKYNQLKKSLLKYRRELCTLNISVDAVCKQIDELNLEKQMFDAYANEYQNAIMLPYAKPEIVFEKYFSSNPPFSKMGSKKNEFPDAFIIEGVLHILKKKTYHSILVVSEDKDWEDSFENIAGVSFCASIDEALIRIQNVEKLSGFISDLYRNDELKSYIEEYTQLECFDLQEYETADGVNVSSLRCVDIGYFVPLKMKKDSILFKCSASILVDGNACIFDDDRSIIDPEDREYVFKYYTDVSFKNARGEFECEVLVSFSQELDDDTISFDSIQLLRKYGIDLSLEGAEVEENKTSDEEVMKGLSTTL